MILVSRIFIVSTDWLVGDMNPYKFAAVIMEIQVSQYSYLSRILPGNEVGMGVRFHVQVCFHQKI